jgi:hypothetical protein
LLESFPRGARTGRTKKQVAGASKERHLGSGSESSTVLLVISPSLGRQIGGMLAKAAAVKDRQATFG